MMKEKEQWMDKLKERLEDYSEPVPASGWEQLERELSPSVEKRIYPYRRWAVAAAAVLLVVASSVSLYFLNSPVADEIRHTAASALAFTPDDLPEALKPAVQTAKTEPAKEMRGVKTRRQVLAQTLPVIREENLEEDAQVENNKEIDEKQITPSTTEDAVVAVEKKSVNSEPKKEKTVYRPSGRDKLHLPEASSASSDRKKWSVGLSVGNAGGTSNSSTSSNLDFYGGWERINMDVTSGMVSIPNDQTLIFQDGVPYLRSQKDLVDIKHHQPVSVGVSVRKQLPKGFSVETGLTYTLLSSDAELSNNTKMQSQKLHYLGIPLRANWNFIDKKRFTLYVSAGGMVEKCVYGSLGKEKLNVKPLQVSVTGAIGAQYNATEHVGFYVEPGVSYFFDDGSSVKTIRKETPCNFNLQAGLRFTY